MKDLRDWLNEENPKKQSKFINHRLRIGEEFIGIYKAVNKAKNLFGRTFHYLFFSEPGEDLIFDSHNPKIVDFFAYIPFESRVSIRKVPKKDGGFFYDIKLLNTLKDEEELARASKDSERAREGKREENKRDGRLDENEI